MDISIKPYSLQIGDKILLKDTDLVIANGTRYGLVGRNGAGKTSLLKDLALREVAQGALLVEQEVASSSLSAIDEVLSANLALQQQLLQEEGEGEAETLPSSNLNPDQERAMVARILAGLGFDEASQQRETSSFSGGWRMRLSLAKALYLKPKLLLLDEPTNHLDLEAVIWLTDYLSKWANSLVVVSHDRFFLNEISHVIILQEHQKLTYYRGGGGGGGGGNVYQKFKKAQEQENRRLETEWQKWLKLEKDLKKQRKTNEEIEKIRLDKKILRPLPPYAPQLEFNYTDQVRGNIISCSEVAYTYPGQTDSVLTEVDLSLDLNTRLVVVGPNGSGKSTLLKLLSGQLTPSAGKININRQLRIGVFDQHFESYLNYDASAIDFILESHADQRFEVADIRRELGRFGLSGSLQTLPIGKLSGGQKARVAFVNLIFSEPHFLFLDEPTNHLDIESIEALILALKQYHGGLLVVTHNVDLILETDCQLLLCRDRKASLLHQDYHEYCQELLDALE